MTHETQTPPHGREPLRTRVAEAIARVIGVVENSGVYVSLQGGVCVVSKDNKSEQNNV